MIVDSFLEWSGIAPVERRIDAADALARSYLYSPLDDAERRKVMTGLFTLLDDPALEVRARLASVFADRKDAPRAIVVQLAEDHPRVASIILAGSPLFARPALIEALMRREPFIDAAVAGRMDLDDELVELILNEGSTRACLALVANPYIRFSADDFAVYLHRFEHDIAALDGLEANRRIPAAFHIQLVTSRARALRDNPFVRACVADRRLDRLADGAQQRAVLTLLDQLHGEEREAAIGALIAQQGLSSAFVLRVCLGGHVAVLEQIMASLCNVSLERVRSAFVHARPVVTASLLKKSRLPEDVRTVVSMTLVLARELATSGVDWTEDFFAETVMEVIDQRAGQSAYNARDALGAATVSLCHSIAADILHQAAREQADDLIAARNSDVRHLIEQQTGYTATPADDRHLDTLIGSALAA